MKVNKNIFICAILVAMMLFCVSAVSAEDSNLNVATNVALDGITEGDALSIAEEGSSEDVFEHPQCDKLVTFLSKIKNIYQKEVIVNGFK